MGKDDKSPTAATEKATRADRLARELRANLKKRKAKARARARAADTEPDDGGD